MLDGYIEAKNSSFGRTHSPRYFEVKELRSAGLMANLTGLDFWTIYTIKMFIANYDYMEDVGYAQMDIFTGGTGKHLIANGSISYRFQNV